MSEELEVLFSVIPIKTGLMGQIILNRPQALNALTINMFELILAELERWKEDPRIKLVMITGGEAKAFSAGGDLREVYESKILQRAANKVFFDYEYPLNQLIFNYPKPYLAICNGLTMGGGAGISIHGRWRVATEKFSLAMPETGIGFFPDVGAGYFLARLPKKIGLYLALTGNRVNAGDAMALGLVDVIVDSNDLPKLQNVLINLDFYHPDAVAEQLMVLHKEPKQDELQVLPKAELIEKYFAADSVEEILSQLMESENQFCQDTAGTLLQKSPLSLKITFQHIRNSEKKTFAEVIQEDARLAKHFINSHDLYAGIAAVIIEKHKQPKWKPATLAEITSEMVNSFFV